MDWTRHFDRIFCVHYAEYRDRLAHIERELDRCIQGEFEASEKRRNGYAAGRDAEELRLLGLRREDYADIYEG